MSPLHRLRVALFFLFVAAVLQLVSLQTNLITWTNDSWKESTEVLSLLGDSGSWRTEIISLSKPRSSSLSTTVQSASEPRKQMTRKRMRNERRIQRNRKSTAMKLPLNTVVDHDRPFASHAYNFSGPVFVLSLPKSGTTSLAKFFKCGGLKAPHTYGHREMDRKTFRLGACMAENFYSHRPLLTGCRPDVYHVYSDIGTPSRERCFYPSIQALEHIAQQYPTATLIVSYRTGWYEATQKWLNGNLIEKWRSFCPVFPNTTNAQEWRDFYDRHRQRIRETVEKYPSLSYLEFNLTDPNAGRLLSDFTGIQTSCWKDCKPNAPCGGHKNSNTSKSVKLSLIS